MPSGSLPSESTISPATPAGPAPPAPKQHLVILDVLRGVAALSVVLFHFTNGALPKIVYSPLKTMFSWGSNGVEIFFVISGFIIPYALDKSHHTTSKFGNFMLKRIVRICPPAYVSLGLIIAQWWVIDNVLHSPGHYMASLSLPRLVHNLLFTIDQKHYTWINGIFWTLAIEFHFYIILGLLFAVLNRAIPYFLGFCGLLLLLSFSDTAAHYSGFFKYSGFFVMGMITWMYYTRRINALVFYGGLILATALTVAAHNWITTGFGTVTALVIIHGHFRSRITTWLGNISYSLYLTHILVGTTLEVVAIRVLPPDSVVNRILVLLFCIGSALVFAYGFHEIVEKRFVALANKVGRKK